jgi:DNA-directed RNA polymerase subunit RPC12/RpoP
MTQEALKQALEALKDVGVLTDREWQAVHKNKANELRQAIAELESQKPATRYCCHSCFKTSGGVMLDRMIVCPTCGNKRCPKASDHTLQCTNSNDLNQVGSIYTHPPQRTEPVGVMVSMDVSKGDEPEYRIFGRIYEVMKDGEGKDEVTYLAIEDSRNFDTPTQRTWVGLTDDEHCDIWYNESLDWMEYGKAIEAKLKQKNGYAEENT